MNFINHILQVILGWLLFWQAYILLFNKGIPNIRTAPAIRRRVIELLRADQAAKPSGAYIIYDLGSGNGLFTRQMARALPQGQIKGVEIANLAYRWAQFFKRLYNLHNLTYQQADFNSIHLGDADAVFMFLRLHMMEMMGKKLHAELKPGALIISNKFALRDGWEPVETINIKTLYLHQKTIYVYRQQ